MTITADATLDGVAALGKTQAVLVQDAGATVRRSVLRADGDALFARITALTDRTVSVDSTVLTAGTGAGVHGRTEGPVLLGTGGALTVKLLRATVAGAEKAAASESVAAGLGTPGAVGITFAQSIVHGSTGTVAVGPGNDTATPDAALFRDAAARDFHLRADAPVIDKGAAVGAGESDKDLDGEPRQAGGATDLGADEFHNAAPSAAIRVDDAGPRQNATVTFDASGSGDPEAAFGGGVARYEWDFGDGTTAVTDGPTAQHAYPEVGGYRATVRVVDRQGAGSAAEGVDVGVRDGLPPLARFTSPLLDSTLPGVTWTVKKVKGKRVQRSRARTIRFFGTASDPSGIGTVELSLRQTQSRKRVAPKLKKPKKKARKAQASCRFYSNVTGRLVTRPCDQPLFFPVRYANRIWSYSTKAGVALGAGRWQATVRATDGAGNPGSATLKFLVK
ncbi:MAG: PKD domain-containing protein [Solirubrobacterales bacterium]|nr:PKD domain-containing protein [Solirubrobacterales bacterium]